MKEGSYKGEGRLLGAEEGEVCRRGAQVTAEPTMETVV